MLSINVMNVSILEFCLKNKTIRTMLTQSFWFILKQALKGGQRWPVVPDVLEQVEGFLKSVGLIVFSDHHVIATARYHKDDGRHICTKTHVSNLWQRRSHFINQWSHCYWCYHCITRFHGQITYRWNIGSISDVRPAGRQHRTYWDRENKTMNTGHMEKYILKLSI